MPDLWDEYSYPPFSLEEIVAGIRALCDRQTETPIGRGINPVYDAFSDAIRIVLGETCPKCWYARTKLSWTHDEDGNCVQKRGMASR